MHDEDLWRVAERRLRVIETSAEILTKIELAESGAPHVRVPRLAEALSLVGQYPGALAFVEIKRASLKAFGTATVVETVIGTCRAGAADFVIISFDVDAVQLARENGVQQVGWAIEQWSGAALATAAALAPDYLFINQRKVPDGMDLPAGPWQWVVYEITDADIAMLWYQRGAALIESMDPVALLTDPRLAPGRHNG